MRLSFARLPVEDGGREEESRRGGGKGENEGGKLEVSEFCGLIWAHEMCTRQRFKQQHIFGETSVILD